MRPFKIAKHFFQADNVIKSEGVPRQDENFRENVAQCRAKTLISTSKLLRKLSSAPQGLKYSKRSAFGKSAMKKVNSKIELSH